MLKGHINQDLMKIILSILVLSVVNAGKHQSSVTGIKAKSFLTGTTARNVKWI